jgi:hypothetical protein
MHDRSSHGEPGARFAVGSGPHLRAAVTTAVQPMLVLVDTPVIPYGVEEGVRSGVNVRCVVTTLTTPIDRPQRATRRAARSRRAARA